MKHGIKMLAFDMDGTLTEGYTWSLAHSVGGVTSKQQKSWMNKFINNQITYNEWINLIEKEYLKSKKTKKDFLSTTNKIIFKKDTNQVIQSLKKDYQIHIVSSSIDIYVDAVATQLGIKHYHANHSFKFDTKGIFEKIFYQASEAEAKVIYLNQLCKDLQIQPQEICFIGDSHGDLSAFQHTQRGILVGKGTPILKKHAWKQTNTLSGILKYLI